MKRLVSLIVVLGMLAFAGTAFGFDFYTPTYSTSFTTTYVPTGGSIASSTAWGCSACLTLDTYATSSTLTVDGWEGSISTATAGALVSTVNCNEPPVCEDGDEDGVCDESDNCEFDYNPSQIDSDSDGIGDVCDPCEDADADGVCDVDDNCVNEPNPAQEDDDQDEIGNACDVCPDDYTNTCNDPQPPPEPCDDTDNDGVCDDDDLCPDTDPADEVDADGCAVPQLCPCDNDWKNHGAYVQCVVDMAQKLVDDGFIEPGIGQDYVNAAGQSDCGGPHAE